MREQHCLMASLFTLCLGTMWPSISKAQNTHELFVQFNASDADLNETAKDVYQWWNAHGHPDIYVMISTQYARDQSVVESVGRLKAAILAQHIMETAIDARWLRPDQADPGTPPEHSAPLIL
jgi:hypothetical protein